MNSNHWVIGLTLAVVGCGNGADTGIDRNVEDRLTIAAGVYGQTTSYDDVGNRPIEYLSMNLEVFEKGPSSSEMPLEKARSNEIGFFEIALPPGEYEACTKFARCTDFEVEPGQCTRLDYELGPGPGWSLPRATSCPK